MSRSSFRSRALPLAVITLAGSASALACGSASNSLFDSTTNAGNSGLAGSALSGGSSNTAGTGALTGGASTIGSGGSSNVGGANAGGESLGGASSGGSNAGGASSVGGAAPGGASGMGNGGAGGAAGSSGAANHAGAAGIGGAGGSAGSGASAGSGGSAGFTTWPGGNSVAVVDESNVFGTNLSGLFYEPASGNTPAILWAVQNSPSTLYRLLWTGSVWTPDTSNKWGRGKTLEYGNAKGSPDSEGVTKTEFGGSAVYVSTERDNDNGNTSRLSV